MAVNAVLKVLVEATRTETKGLTVISDPTSKELLSELTNGTGAGKVNLVYQDQRSLADAADETLDLEALTDPVFGDTLTFDVIKVIYIQNTSADATLIIGAGAANPWLGFITGANDTVELMPGVAMCVLFDQASESGIVVSPTNSDLKFVHNGEGASDLVYEIIIVGEGTSA